MASSTDNWGLDPDPRRRQFDVVRDLLARHSQGQRVLDVGCFNGALLKYLGDQWERFGVEPSREAGEVARERGVSLLGGDLGEIAPSIPPFHAILVIDVIEHIANPVPFFDELNRRLASHGIIILLTGNTDSILWRLQRGAYWYSSLPEHVSFYNRRSLEWICANLEMSILEFRRVRHKRVSVTEWCTGGAKSAVYVAGRRTKGLGIPRLRRLFVDRRGPSVATAKDHLVCVLARR